MSKEVLADLYDFLKENETGLCRQNNKIIAYVHVYFHDLNEFSQIVGASTFDDGGLTVLMFDNTICIELNDIFEAYGHGISNYKNCFDKYSYDQCEKEILEMEG